jgi:hypothetical protein
MTARSRGPNFGNVAIGSSTNNTFRTKNTNFHRRPQARRKQRSTPKAVESQP